jgi:hypothetical protein
MNYYLNALVKFDVDKKLKKKLTHQNTKRCKLNGLIIEDFNPTIAR